MIATIYTDGSFDAPSKTCAWAYQVQLDGKVHHQEFGTDVPKGAEAHWNIAGECMAAVKAMEWAERCADSLEVTDLTIVHDYEGVGKWFTTAWKAKKPFTQWYVKRMHELSDKFDADVHFRWVKGHTGDTGNEHVDGLAKSAMQAKREEKKAVIPIEQRLCVTGHRKLFDTYSVSRWEQQTMDMLLRKAVENGIKYFVSGGALRIDQAFALSVLKLRDEGHQIKMAMAVPCANQDYKWFDDSKKVYRDILKRADAICFVPIVSETCNGFVSYEKLEELETLKEYNFNNIKDCMLIRDRWMVDNVGTVMAFMARERSGTGTTVRYAISKGRKVLHADPITKTVKWLK